MNDANWFKVFDDRVATFDGDGLPSYAYATLKWALNMAHASDYDQKAQIYYQLYT